MKYILSGSLKFYQNNGLLGICSRKIWQLRGRADNYERIPPNLEDPSRTSKPPLTAQQIDEILNANCGRAKEAIP